jgi:hypothetical protein
MCKVLL